MSNEEFEKKMAFIVEQQALFSVNMQQMQESQAQHDVEMRELRESQTRTEQVFAQAGEIVARLANVTLVGFKDLSVKIDALIDSQIRTDEKFRILLDRDLGEGRPGV